MARYRPNYDHLRDRPTPWIIDQAIQFPPVMQMPEHIRHNANIDLLQFFGHGGEIRYGEILFMFERSGLWKSSGGKRWSNNYAGERAGGLIGLGLKLGAVVEDRTDEGERCFRLMCREPVYEMVGDRLLKVRCLTPDQERELAGVLDKARKRAASTAKLRATLARKHAEELRPEIHNYLLQFSRAEIDIPEDWDQYVPADILQRWPNFGVAAGMLLDIHMDWPKAMQNQWKNYLWKLWFDKVEKPRAAPEMEAARERSRRKAAALNAELRGEPAPVDEIPAEDLAALGDL